MSFYLRAGNMCVTLDDALCILHLPIIGTLLDHTPIQRADELYLIITHLGVDLCEAQ